MLIVSSAPVRYLGRYREKATELVKSGTRVGMLWLSKEDAQAHCHVCDKDFQSPTLDPEHHDFFGECPHCKTPFIFADICLLSARK